jgi:uncharacterized membrane protein (UPF0182 family)
MKRYAGFFRVTILVVATLIGLGWAASSIYPDWLWFQNLNFESVFVTLLVSKILIGLTAALIFVLAVGINYYVARFYVKKTRPTIGRQGGISVEGLPISEKTVSRAIGVFLVIVAVMVGSAASTRWSMILMYFHPKSFGIVDPIFVRDVAFYVFSLPFFLFLKSWLTGFLVFSGMVALLVYSRGDLIHMEIGTAQTQDQDARPGAKIRLDPPASKHLSIIGIGIIALVVWGYWLKVYQLMYSTKGPAFGASYTDIHIQLIAYKILMVVLGAFAILVGINLFLQKRGLLVAGLIGTIGAMVIAGSVIPSVVQKIIVKPNELDMESPYIAYNIENTRRAYGLDRIQEKDFIVRENLTMADILDNRMTIENIRIWDERPLKETYNQLQSIRSYYDFSSIDVDRYFLEGQYRQVTLSAREISAEKLPLQARTWVNRHLKFTHGYGLALNPVNQVTQEGLPNLFIKDLPPVSRGIDVKRPEIYYGEKTENYVIVRTKTTEFDYPKGDSNVYTTYQGEGGVLVNSFMRRLLFAVYFRNPQIFFTRYLTPESRIMFSRRIDSRVKRVAPFLRFDRDPYLVIADGQLYWIVDGYTTTSMYPYSSRLAGRRGLGINYIRNSVKGVVNAYTGRVDLYVVDETDPIIQSFMEIFPDLFRPFSEMPDHLKGHIRYPRDLFDLQAAMYESYHMQDVQVFYNQEDLWQIPNELYADTQQEMEPYYIIIKLPGESREEFLLMLPFTPSKKANMIAWLAARSDIPNYGDLLVYKLPKDKLMYGPMQVEARVDQQTDISRELTLWGQKGSRVIRGNLMAIPVEQSFLYVEPVYLQASQEPEQQPEPRGGMGRTSPSRSPKPTTSIALPELKRVIVAYGNEVVMKESLAGALAAIFEGPAPSVAAIPDQKMEGKSIQDLAISVLDQYRTAQKYLKAGDWGGYGVALDKMEKMLEELAAQLGQVTSPER